ncbi:hypothetical protein [Cellulomonas endophytica]|uniref:COG4315 family predicted lipoprotein n=1 Tax=Cellulomonas endophytica TaxID=2494735 RepID=UPI001010E3A3|nr:hypothetical protein [Cellulomonas endophytica]
MVTARAVRVGRGTEGGGVRAGRRGAVPRGERRTRWAAALVALVVLAGCSSSPGASGDDAGGASQEPAASAPASSAPADEPTTEPTGSASPDTTASEDAAGATGVGVATTSLGDVLVDTAGMTLYMFDKDERGGASTCYDQCASAWPPLLVEGTPAAGEGADDAMLGTVERTDGTVQVTYGGWPLYYWAQDAAAGDVTGQGVNDVWWVLTADGEPVRG